MFSTTDFEPPITLVTKVQHHLKVLRSFEILREHVLKCNKRDTWEYYVTAAVRRFNLWVSAFRFRFPENFAAIETQFVLFRKYLLDTLPPLDILLVWHTFLLNPKLMYDTFENAGFSHFLKIPFPLSQICEYISSETGFYNPPSKIKKRFEMRMNTYLNLESMKESFKYDSYLFFNAELKVPLACPICHHKLVDIPIKKANKKNLKVSSGNNCKCGFNGTITTEQLASRKLLKDQSLFKPIPSIVRHYGKALNKTIYGLGVHEVSLDQELKTFLLINQKKLKDKGINELIGICNSQNKFMNKILNGYLDLIPINFSVNSKSALLIHHDLVGSVLRITKFSTSIIKFTDNFDKLQIKDSIRRYSGFILLASKVCPLIPTLDIDLIWHTHQLDLQKYLKYTKDIAGDVVDHQDKMSLSFCYHMAQKTEHIYQQRFNEPLEYNNSHKHRCQALTKTSTHCVDDVRVLKYL